MRNRICASIVSAATILILAGCSVFGTNAQQDAPAASLKDPVQVFSWWVDGSEAQGLNAFVRLMAQNYPDLQFENMSVTGGAGSNAKQVLADQLATYDPPDSFQAHAGMEMADYVTQGQIFDLTDFYQEQGLTKVFPKDLIAALTQHDRIYSVPANIHRANMLWSNPQVLRKAGLDPTASYKNVDEWIRALEKVKKSGVTPVVIGASWTQVNLLESVLIADLGADGYRNLWTGKTSWSSAKVTTALRHFDEIIRLSNKDRHELEWVDALSRLEQGQAAFYVMGDWAAGQLDTDGLVFEEGYNAAPFPGTDGVFDFLADAFTYPVGAPNPEGTKAWLTTVSSVEGQVAFNRIKGSIPARTDIDPTQFSKYQQSAIEDFSHDVIVPSLAHGAAVTAGTLSDITKATEKFTSGSVSLEEFRTKLAAATSDG